MKYILVVFALFLVSCAEKKEKVSAPKEELIMYEFSEMALLMEQMYEENEVLKASIENGTPVGTFNADYYKMHSAEMTDPKDRTTEFEILSKAFLETQQQIYQHEGTEQVQAFNNMVNTCISCHKISCTGPIPRIEKLRIR